MKKTLFLLILLCAGFAAASAQPSNRPKAFNNSKAAYDAYESKEFVSTEGQSLKYRVLAPQDMNAKKKYPLVIFMHGAGERGDDNEAQLTHGGQMFLNPVMQEKYPAYVLFPQCPSKGFWARPSFPNSPKKGPKGPGGNNEMSPILKAVKELLDKYIALPNVDPTRVYIMGLSMGGMATFDMVCRFPEMFAAAVPICGAVGPGRLAAAKDVKFRIFHGDADPTVPVECSRMAYRELKAAGADVEYIEYPGCAHASWTPAFNEPDFLEWVFAQKNRRAARKNK